MKNGIKIIAALFFIVSAFLVGKYFCIDDCKVETDKINAELNSLKEQNNELQLNLNFYKERLQNESIKPVTEGKKGKLK